MRKFKFFILFMFLISNCSKKFPNEEIIDSSPPKVINTTPANCEINVPTSKNIEILFSEEIDENSFSPSLLIITPFINFNYKIEGNKLLIYPKENLITGQRYWITIKKDLKDKNGNSMKSDYSFTFKVEGHNLSQAPVTFKVDASLAKKYYPVLYFAGSFDIFGDYDPQWNMGKRYPLYDDGLHNDNNPSDGIFANSIYLTIDINHSYQWVVDEDYNPDNGYIKLKNFNITTASPKIEEIKLYPPITITFNYYDIENKVKNEIYLRGDFNNWGLSDRMNGPSGTQRVFTITKTLKEGTYYYKYYVDGNWDLVNQNNRMINIVYGGSTIQNDYYEGGIPVAFNYYDIENKVQNSIYLKGDFNGWSDVNKMSGPFGTNRKFTTTINLKPGVDYQYKYYVDNDWDKVNLNNRTIKISSGTTEINDYYLGPISVTFNYHDIESKVQTSIHIRGDFNNWTLDYKYQLTMTSNNIYSITFDIFPGTYNYKYYVDGDWNKVNINNRTVTINSANKIINDYYAGP